MKVLVTGAAGFIGFHVSRALLGRGDEVVGIDNFNEYYDVSLKEARADILERQGACRMVREDVAQHERVREIVARERPDKVCHLAAQAGVRYSLENPFAYVRANEVGFLSVLEAARHEGVRDVVYASSSSVYGGNEKIPFSEMDAVERPLSLYAATKRANELVAHTYSSLFGLNTTGLRFFTVYGPWGRPDMALFKFADRMRAGESIDVFNEGKMQRDFTFIDDIVKGVVAAIDRPLRCEVFNLGRGEPVELSSFIDCLEGELDVKASRVLLPMQPGDVARTWADVSKTKRMLGYEPTVSVPEGVRRFCEWYLKWRRE